MKGGYFVELFKPFIVSSIIPFMFMRSFDTFSGLENERYSVQCESRRLLQKQHCFVIRCFSHFRFTAALCLMWSPEFVFVFFPSSSELSRSAAPGATGPFLKPEGSGCGWYRRWPVIGACAQTVPNTCPPARRPTSVGRWISTAATTLWLTVTQSDARTSFLTLKLQPALSHCVRRSRLIAQRKIDDGG